MMPDVECPSNDTSLRSEVVDTSMTSCGPIGATTADGEDVATPCPAVINCKCHEILTNLLASVAEESRPADVPAKPEVPVMQQENIGPCLCHSQRIAYALPVKTTKDESRAQRPLWCRLMSRLAYGNHFEDENRTYEVKLKESQCPRHDKSFVSCDVTEEKSRREVPEETKPPPPPRYRPEPKKRRDDVTERIDIYYFDHGNSAYYRTTDSPPILATERCAEKTDQAATRFWAEIFGTIHIGTAFVTAFLLQLLRFLLSSVVRPLTVGVLQLFADYFIKPCLSIVFNALIQPVLILLYNVATSFKDLCEPVAEALGLFVRELANLCRAVRLVEVKPRETIPASCT